MATTEVAGAFPRESVEVGSAAPRATTAYTDQAGKRLPVVKVAIVGGGMAGMAVAWELCRQSRAEDRTTHFKITVFERAPHLGGKGASTRDEHGRILEHGLHVWLGFYENAFRMMRQCYAEVEREGWGPNAGPGKVLPHGSFDEAFVPEPHIGVANRRRSGALDVWSGFLPPMKGEPGEELDVGSNPFTLWAYLSRCLGLVRALMQSMIATAKGEAAPGDPRPDGRSVSDEAQELEFSAEGLKSPTALVEYMVRMMRVGALTTSAGLLQGVTIFEGWLRERNPAPQSNRTILKFAEALAAQTRKQLRDFVAIDEDMRRKTEIIDIVITVLVGLYRDKVFFSKQGLDAINHIDYRAWLKGHGATKTSVESPFITGIYDLVFAYRNGNRKRPALAAGQAIRGALRMFFSYRGAMFWRMASGMGDAVFAPLYKVLNLRGVDFRFRHELKGIAFGSLDGGRVVHSLTFADCGDVAHPLDHFGCWPAKPPEAQTETLLTWSYDRSNDRSGSDNSFDAVVFAMGPDALEKASRASTTGGQAWEAGEAAYSLQSEKKWAAMFKHVKTVATQSAQVWLSRDLQQLGWNRGAVIVSSFDGPFGTWADMTRTLASEQAHRGKRAADASKAVPDYGVRSLAYFCGVLPDKPAEGVAWTLDAARNCVKECTRTMLAETFEPIWPAAYRRDAKGKVQATALDAIAGLEATSTPGAANFDAQHFKANIEGSDRYTLSLPGSIEFRISPLDTSILNMTIAGDWTDCGFNAGCVEAAVMSGLLAAHAISEKPDLNTIIGYHHP